MRTVGQSLKEARIDKGYTLEDVEKHTKIRVEMLEALENDAYDKLPPSTFVQGFIKNYGQFLNLDINSLMALFRRDYEGKKRGPAVMESLSKPVEQKRFQLTPARILIGVVFLVVFCFFAYLWVEFRQFAGAPDLNLESPQEQQTVDIPRVVVKGKTDPDAIVSVNEQEIGVDDQGVFEEEIQLSSSTNKITVKSKSKFGPETTLERTVFVKQ